MNITQEKAGSSSTPAERRTRGARWSYGYDPFGRRVSKTWRDGPSADGSVGSTYSWDGHVVAMAAAMMADGALTSARTVTWHCEPGGSVPMVREEAGDLHYVAADHLGTPRELFDETGAVVWAREHSLWGSPRRLENNNRVYGLDDNAAITAPKSDPCPIVFQGQWADVETGLHYNRYRYYDPIAASYVSPGLR